jgi:pSer/pThr/pTyr-binding forkhead associated (FHA) protein
MSIGLPVDMQPTMLQQDEELTQTQAFDSKKKHEREAQEKEMSSVVATLRSFTSDFSYELKKKDHCVHIGRHPDCHIKVDDKRVSGFHVKIYRDESFRYFIQDLSSNGCFINNKSMNKGDTRSLQNGDEISLCCYGRSTEEKPFAVYSFRTGAEFGGQASTSTATSTTAPVGGTAAASLASSSAPRELTGSVTGSRLVTEQWVQERWDARVVLGSGNFSEVRLGVQIRDSAKRAVKVIDKKKFLQFQNKRESHLSLTSEANVLTGLDHPGIVKAYDWFETEQSLYLVMELLEGGDLLQCIVEGGCFAENRARQLFRQLCEAIAYLHEKDIVHRDLKPENILLTSKDRDTMCLKLADFGLARKNMKSRDCRTFCGTPHYFAPEVINTFRFRDESDSTGYGKPCDMWSLGVILYILLSGIPPFEDDDLYKQILEGKYEFDVSEWTSVTPEAKELVKKLMTVNPKDRLTIHQALEHKWFRFSVTVAPSSPSAQRRFAAEARPSAKKPRQTEAAMSIECLPLNGSAQHAVPDCNRLGA